MRSALFALLVLFCAGLLPAAITGTVVNDDGAPIAGASISSYPAESSRELRQRLLSATPEREPLARVTSADDGTFRLEVKNAAAVDLAVSAPGRYLWETTALPEQDLGSVVLPTATPRTLRVTAGGKPVSGALVLLGRTLMLKSDAAGQIVTTGTVGEVTVIHPEHALRTFLPRDGATEIVLTDGVKVAGRVVDGTKPVANAAIFISGWPLGKSGDDGTFVIAHAPDSWRSIQAVAGDRVAERLRSQPGAIELRLGPATKIAVAVRDSATGSGVGGARVNLFTGMDLVENGLTDSRGSVVFDSLVRHTYFLAATHPDYSIGGSSPLQSGKTTLEAQPLARVSGRVIDESGQPVERAMVGTFFARAMPGGAGIGGSSLRRTAITDKDGRYSLALPSTPNATRLLAMKTGFATGVSPLRTIKPGAKISGLDLSMVRGFPLQLRILDSARKPYAGAQVLMMRTEEDAQPVPVSCDGSPDACRATGSDGIYPARIVEGTYEIRVNSDHSIPKSLHAVKLNARSSPYEVQIEAGVSVSGRVVGSDGAPAAGAFVETVGSNERTMASVDADGSFMLQRLPAGPLSLVAISADRHLTSSPLEVTAPAQKITLTLPRGGRIEGRVLDRATQQPVTDFNIIVSRRAPMTGGGFPPLALHADDGAYGIDGVPAGTADVHVSAPGYVAATRTAIVVEEGKTVSGIDVLLDRGARLTGHVTSAGNAVSGVIVGLSPGRMMGGTIIPATSDADGQYLLDGIPAGQQSIEFRKPGFVRQVKSVDLVEGKDTRLDLELDRGRSLSGRVLSSAGRPVMGANLSVNGDAANGRVSTMVQSDSDGAFLIEGLADGRYTITARKSGYLPATRTDIDPAQSAALTLTLETGGTISGRVTGLAEADLANTIVSGMAPNNGVNARPDSTGAFTLRGVPDGRVQVSAQTVRPSLERRSMIKSVSVENGATAPVEIDFAAGITIRGRVTVSGEPLVDGMLNFYPAHPSPSTPQGGLGRIASGLYEVTGLAGAAYDVMVNGTLAGGARITYKTQYTASADAVFDIDIKGATVTGRVVDGKSEAPVNGAMLFLRGGQPMLGRNAMSDSDGRFTFPAVADGHYQLTASREPYAPGNQDLDVSGGAAVELTIKLDEGTAVIIHVIDAATNHPIQANVTAIDGKGKPAGSAMQQDDAARLYLQPGQYVIHAYARDYLTNQQSISVPGDPPSLALTKAAQLLIRTQLNGRARLIPPASAAPIWNGMLATGSNGPFPNLRPGSYLLELLGPTGTPIKSMPVNLQSGETTTVDLQ